MGSEVTTVAAGAGVVAVGVLTAVGVAMILQQLLRGPNEHSKAN